MSPFSVLAQASGSTLWWLAGAGLLLLGLVAPDPAIPAMGLGAFLVGLLLLKFSLPPFAQVLIWLLFSVGMTLVLRRLLSSKPTHQGLTSSGEARTLTPISSGSAGQVFFEGTSWNARCDTLRPGEIIGVDVPVYVVRQEGNTLFVVPESQLTGG